MNRVCEALGIEKPIIQGPCFWLTDAEFVAAVSEAGALGVLGFNAGHKESVYTVEETTERMREQVRLVKAATDKPFGINFGVIVPEDQDQFSLAMMDMMAEEGVPVAVLAGNCSAYWADQFHQRGIKVVYRPMNPTRDAIRAGVEMGVDVLVATGFDEGGTVPTQVVGTFTAVPNAVDAAEGKVPVMAAGGITEGRTARAAFALGAEGLYVGSAFLVTEESPMAHNIKEMAVASDAHDLLLYRTVPAYYRSLPGELPNKLLQMSKDGATEEEIFEAQKRYDGMRNGMLFGDLSEGFASFGTGISMIHDIVPVATLVDRLMAGVPQECR